MAMLSTSIPDSIIESNILLDEFIIFENTGFLYKNFFWLELLLAITSSIFSFFIDNVLIYLC